MQNPKCEIVFREGKETKRVIANITLKDGQTIMVYQPTNEDVISSVTGRTLGKAERVIGVGKIRNGKVLLEDSLGTMIEAEIKRLGRINQSRNFFKTRKVKASSASSQQALRVKLIEE